MEIMKQEPRKNYITSHVAVEEPTGKYYENDAHTKYYLANPEEVSEDVRAIVAIGTAGEPDYRWICAYDYCSDDDCTDPMLYNDHPLFNTIDEAKAAHANALKVYYTEIFYPDNKSEYGWTKQVITPPNTSIIGVYWLDGYTSVLSVHSVEKVVAKAWNL